MAGLRERFSATIQYYLCSGSHRSDLCAGHTWRAGAGPQPSADGSKEPGQGRDRNSPAETRPAVSCLRQRWSGRVSCNSALRKSRESFTTTSQAQDLFPTAFFQRPNSGEVQRGWGEQTLMNLYLHSRFVYRRKFTPITRTNPVNKFPQRQTLKEQTKGKRKGITIPSVL